MASVPKELLNFYNLIENYIKGNVNFILEDWETNRNEFQVYFTTIYKKWFPRTKDYTDKHIGGQIFKKSVMTKDLKSYYKYEMYACLRSIDRINQQIVDLFKKDEFKALPLYIKLMRELVIEGIEYLNYVSIVTEGKTRNYGMFKRGIVNSKELFDSAFMLFYSDFNLNRFGGFALAPSSVMVLRQAIELRLRNAFGIYFILEQNGSPVKIPQKFFFSFIKVHAASVELPVDLSIIENIFDWTQTFVHGGIMKQTWEVEWAFYLLKPLFDGAKEPEGSWHNLGSIKIEKQLIDNLQNEINSSLGRLEKSKYVILDLKAPDALVLS